MRKGRNVRVLMGDVVDLDEAIVLLEDGTSIAFDCLIVALGSTPSYFNNPSWQRNAPPLKSLEDALEMRTAIFKAFEDAELEPDEEKRKALLTFTIVGGGSTGVELAGALSEITQETLRTDFRTFDPRSSRIVLVDTADRLLPSYPPELSSRAEEKLRDLGIEIRIGTTVDEIEDDIVRLRRGDEVETIPCHTTLWAAGVAANPFGEVMAQRFDCKTARGRVIVSEDLSIPGYPNIFVVGDLSSHPDDLPGVAQVAIQGGQHAAKSVLRGNKPFVYRNKGNLSVIGRNAAVAEIGRFKFSGVLAWLIWAWVHIAYLIGFDNKLIVMFQWAWNYWFFDRSARLITPARKS
jgi:NADH dehydrogenase